MALASYAGFAAAFIAGILYLRSGNKKYDRIGYLSIHTATIFLGIALVLGSAFAKVAWGAWWNWDPKEVLTLVTFLIYASYLQARRLVEDNVEKVSAALAIIGFAAAIFNYFATKFLLTLHPEGLDRMVLPIPAYVFVSAIIVALAAFFAIVRYRYKKSKR